MGRNRFSSARQVLGGAVVLALLTGVADAKPWRKWAPGPLASDSSYAALLARPSDSLTAGQLTWLAVQRDWRTQRDAESTTSSSASITETGRPHLARRSDKRFTALVARPYAALADTDRAWLVAENAAQQVARESQGGSSSAIGVLLMAAIVGVLAAAVVAAYVISHTYYPPF